MPLLQETLAMPMATNTSVVDSIPDIRQEIQMLRSMPFDELVDSAVRGLITFAINLTIAIAVFYIGKFIIRKVFNLVRNIMLRRQVDASLMTFVLSMIKIVMYFILIVIVIGILGIETSSFVAIFGAAGLAVGMALSGTLQNFAGGVLILLLKPYKVGDYIETQGYAGYVREIQIFHTIINTYDNKSIILPNGGLSTGSINNWSREDYRRVEWTVSISYGDSVDDARKAILDIFASDDRVVEMYIEDDRAKRGIQDPLEMNDNTDIDDPCLDNPDDPDCMRRRPWYVRMLHRRSPAVAKKLSGVADKITQARVIKLEKVPRNPSVSVDVLNTSSVDLKARAWTRTEFYWPLFYNINERIYNELPKAGIHFPFPQMDVHVKNGGA